MKKILYICLLFTFFSVQAKKVKFSVDMTDVALLGSGVHIMGDFQVVAGLAADSFNTLTPLAKEGSTAIYSLIVDIPAFHKYEYKFVNGDQFYDTEFVPLESRVGHDFNDNRWIYVDSLANDTTYIGAVLYSGNAPSGQKLVRFLVDTRNITPNANGLYVGTTQTGLDPKVSALYSFIEDTYEAILFLSSGTYQYRYFNGTGLSDSETITGACTNGLGNRSLGLVVDSVLPSICYATCSSCDEVTGIENNWLEDQTKIYPNPSNGEVTIEMTSPSMKEFTVTARDGAGKVVSEYTNQPKNKLHLINGLYLISIKDKNNMLITRKLVIK